MEAATGAEAAIDGAPRLIARPAPACRESRSPCPRKPPPFTGHLRVFRSRSSGRRLVATYPIGEMLFVRAATALVGASLVILPRTGLAVFRTRRLRDHMLRGISQSCAQSFLIIAFSLS